MHDSTPTRSGGPSVSPPESSGRQAPSSGPARVIDMVMAYIALTKPRVIELLLVAAIPALLQADRGHIHHTDLAAAGGGAHRPEIQLR